MSESTTSCKNHSYFLIQISIQVRCFAFHLTPNITESSLNHQGSIQGESDTEPDGLLQSITNKLGGIFSDDSSDDADVSDTDENDDTFDPSLDKPVFLTPKGPIQVSRGKSSVVDGEFCTCILFDPLLL